MRPRHTIACSTLTLGALLALTGCSGTTQGGPSPRATVTVTSSLSSTSSPAAPTSAAVVPGTENWPTVAPGGRMPARQTDTPPGDAQPPPPAPGAAVRARVKGFVSALITIKGVTRDQWATNVARFTAPELARTLALTDPANITAQKITGDPQLLYTSTTEAVTGWFVPTSGAGYTVTASEGGDQLQIVSVDLGKVVPTPDPPVDQD